MDYFEIIFGIARPRDKKLLF